MEKVFGPFFPKLSQLKECLKNKLLLPTPGEAKAKAMPGRLYIHTINKK